MSVPSSLNVGPNTSLILVKKRYLIFYVFLIWISIFSIQFEFWFLWKLYNIHKYIQFYFFLPILIILIYLSSVFISLIFAKILLLIVNLIHKPREGIFVRDRSNKDYRFWSLRNTIKKWPIWLSHKFPFPFMNNICLRIFGLQCRYSNSLFEGWVDTEFIKFGKNVVIGQGAVIQSAIIVGNLFIIRKTIIEDNAVIGAQSLVMPGTHMRKNSILGGHSMTTVGQELDESYIYIGAPAKKFKKNIYFEDGLEEIIKKQLEKKFVEQSGFEDFYTMRKDKETIIE
ncbi:MAG: DapH/DapD/GlmU-related protein [Candidatus Odinarchaeota archaeon]